MKQASVPTGTSRYIIIIFTLFEETTSIFPVLQVDLLTVVCRLRSPYGFRRTGWSLHYYRGPGRSLNSFSSPSRRLYSFRHPGRSRHRFRGLGRSPYSFRSPGQSLHSFRSPSRSRQSFKSLGRLLRSFRSPGRSIHSYP